MLKGQMVWSGWRAVGIERIYKNNTCEPRRGLGKNKGKADLSDCLIRKARPLGMTWNSFLQQEWAHCRGKVHFLHLDSIQAMHEFLNSSCVYIQTTCIQENRLLSCHCLLPLCSFHLTPMLDFSRLERFNPSSALTERKRWQEASVFHRLRYFGTLHCSKHLKYVCM